MGRQRGPSPPSCPLLAREGQASRLLGAACGYSDDTAHPPPPGSYSVVPGLGHQGHLAKVPESGIPRGLTPRLDCPSGMLAPSGPSPLTEHLSGVPPQLPPGLRNLPLCWFPLRHDSQIQTVGAGPYGAFLGQTSPMSPACLLSAEEL